MYNANNKINELIYFSCKYIYNITYIYKNNDIITKYFILTLFTLIYQLAQLIINTVSKKHFNYLKCTYIYIYLFI